MLRVLHTADVHLGARHADLGEQAAAQRERQFAAFRATVDLALAEPVDLVLIAGDLFDSNVQPRRSVERVTAELRRLVEARIRTVLIPGTHDVYDRASIYRSYDLPALAGAVGSDLLTVLTPDRASVTLEPLDLVVHGSIAIPGQTAGDEVVITTEEIAATHLDYLALGHWHSTSRGRAGTTVYAYSGAPEPVALDQDRAGKALLIVLDEHDGKKTVELTDRQVGQTRFERLEMDAPTVPSQPALIQLLAGRADPNLVLDVRLIGVRPDALDLHAEEVETALAGQFLKIRVRDRSVPALSEGAIPPADTILGAFIRDVEARVAEIEAAGDEAAAGEVRDALRLGRLLLAGEEVTL
jgi:exonuclease SbcD